MEAMEYAALRRQTPPAPRKKQYGKIYVCSPLSAPSWLETHHNMENARHYARLVSRLFRCRALAAHAYLPLLLDDNDPEERKIGLETGLRILEICDALIICGRSVSKGMAGEIRRARELGIPILYLEDYMK